jgi:hypothetical protein
MDADLREEKVVNAELDESFASFLEIQEKRGLWDNIHAKRKRIKSGSGERMRKPGSEGAPTVANFKSAQESVASDKRKKIELVDRPPASQAVKTRHAEIQNKIIDESGKPYVKSFSQTGSTEHSGWKASNKHGKVKFFGKDFKASAMKHAGISEDKATDREIGTESLVKKYKKDTPGQKSNLDESFNMAWTSGIGVTLSAADCGIKIKSGFELHPDVIDQMQIDEFDEEVRSADIEGVVVHTADGKTIVRKQKRNRKIIGTGNLTDGKPDDTI